MKSDENRTAEEVEEDYPKILEDLKFHVAKQQIIDENDIKVEFSDIEAIAEEVARAQFAQYGMTNLPADVLQIGTCHLFLKEEFTRKRRECPEPVRQGYREQTDQLAERARDRDRKRGVHRGV